MIYICGLMIYIFEFMIYIFVLFSNLRLSARKEAILQFGLLQKLSL